ncbi:MAG: hypothetical protein D3909_16530, partial [Candidatus Electrothrix sp. ATG1]|nr:hypothetical protein [Candidatus Electrothrix sp. ATG1]
MAYLHKRFRPYLTKNTLLKLAACRNPEYPPAPSADWGIPLKYYLHTYRNPANKHTLLKLAACRNPEYPPAPSADWGIPLKYYLHTYRNPANKQGDAEEYVGFIKDDFAEKLSEADSLRDFPYAENCWVDDVEFLIREADDFSSSMLLNKVCQLMPKTASKDWIAEQVHAQLEHGNGHHAYAKLLLEDDIFADEERWEMIDRYIEIAPKSAGFILPFLKWLENFAPEHEDRSKFLAKKLLEEPGQNGNVASAALRILSREKKETKPLARKLLQQPRITGHPAAAALRILNREEAEVFAKKILKESGQVAEVKCIALKFLDKEEAGPFAKNFRAIHFTSATCPDSF